MEVILVLATALAACVEQEAVAVVVLSGSSKIVKGALWLPHWRVLHSLRLPSSLNIMLRAGGILFKGAVMSGALVFEAKQSTLNELADKISPNPANFQVPLHDQSPLQTSKSSL